MSKTIDIVFSRGEDRGPHGYPVFYADVSGDRIEGRLEVLPGGDGRVDIITGYDDSTPERKARTILINGVEHEGRATLSDGTSPTENDRRTGEPPRDRGRWRYRYPHGYFRFGGGGSFEDLTDSARGKLHRLCELLATQLPDFHPWAYELGDLARAKADADDKARAVFEAQQHLSTLEDEYVDKVNAEMDAQAIVNRFERAAEEGRV